NPEPFRQILAFAIGIGEPVRGYDLGFPEPELVRGPMPGHARPGLQSALEPRPKGVLKPTDRRDYQRRIFRAAAQPVVRIIATKIMNQVERFWVVLPIVVEGDSHAEVGQTSGEIVDHRRPTTVHPPKVVVRLEENFHSS